MTYDSFPPSLQEINSTSTSIGQVGTPEKMPPISPIKQSSSPLKDIQSSMKPSSIKQEISTTSHPNNSSYKDTCPYQRKTATWQEALKGYSLMTNKNKEPMPQTVDTEAQGASMNQQYKSQKCNPQKLKEECKKLIQAFRRMYQQWRLSTEVLKYAAAADHFRKKSSDTALFLQKIFPSTYNAVTKRLKTKGVILPTLMTSQWAPLLKNKSIIAGLKLALVADCTSNCVAPIPLGGTSCYDPGPGSTNFSHPPAIPKPSPATIPLPVDVQPTAPIIPSSFATAIPEIPITWPISHTHQDVPTKYPEDPVSVLSDNSNKDSPMRTRSPSPIAGPSNLPEMVTLEAHKQPLPLWQAWLSLPRSPHPERRSISPSSEDSAPKHLHHDDGSYTPRSPLNPIVSLGLDSLDYDYITI